MKYKVSVIVPTYNGEKYISRAIDSLLNQTLKEIEIIIINDGSTDNTKKIIDEYSTKNSNIVVINQVNKGVSYSRNLGVNICKSDYFSFMDHDDYADSTMYEQLYKKIVSEKSDIAICNYYYEYEYKTICTNWTEESLSNAKIYPKLLLKANSFVWNKLYRKKFWNTNKFSFIENLYFDDSCIMYEVLLRACKVSVINNPLYHYYKLSSDSICNSADYYTRLEIFKSCDFIVKAYNRESKNNMNIELLDILTFICYRHIYGRMKGMSIKNKIKFNSKAIKYMNSNFNNWKSNKYINVFITGGKNTKINRIKLICLKNELLSFLYFSILSKVLYKTRKWKNKILDKPNRTKRKRIQKNGLKTIAFVTKILNQRNITNFIDYGTLLGIIRDGKLLDHDIDIDIGVVYKNKNNINVKTLLLNNGFKLWRQYMLDGNILEESYVYNGIKVDISYYFKSDLYYKTYLFYNNKDCYYKNNNQRSIVMMNYKYFNGKVREYIIGDNINNEYISVNIPNNPIELIVEKYGADWIKKKKNWVYWKNPSAVQVPEIGYYHQYQTINSPFNF